jgi:hypothetical protein
MCVRSMKAARTPFILPSPMTRGSPLRALLMGENKPWMPGRISATCRSFPTTFWYRLIWTSFFFRIRRILVTMSVALASEIRTVLISPLMRKPRMSFVWCYLASSRSSFSREIGSLPPMGPVILGEGNTA